MGKLGNGEFRGAIWHVFVDSTRFQRGSLSIILLASSEILRQTLTAAKDDQATNLKVSAVLLCPATSDERVIAAVKCFVVLQRDRFVMGSK
jgi:hypothetical protein